jgi:hypothetical protein
VSRSALIEVCDRAEDALAQLHRFHSSDQAASNAMRAVRLTALTLECWWIPALDAGGNPTSQSEIEGTTV